MLPTGLSLLAALLAVALPSLLYAGQVMTENVFYPLFLCVVLLLVLTLERPTRRAPARVARALRARVPDPRAGARVLPGDRARARARGLVAVVPRALRRARRARRLLALLAQLVRGESPLGLLGAYAVTGEHRYEAAEVARWLLYHVAELDLYLGVVPFAALLVLLALWRRLPRVLRPFLAATAALSVCFLLEVSAFASLPSVARIEERNLFYLAPLALIALLVWIDQGAAAAAARGRRRRGRRGGAARP